MHVFSAWIIESFASWVVANNAACVAGEQTMHYRQASATDSDVDRKSRYGVDVETDEEDGTYFDTNDFLSSESLRSVLYRSRDGRGNGCSSMTCEAGSFFFDGLRDVGPSKAVDYPYIKRRDNLPEPKGKEKPVGLWSIIKDNVGNDLSGVSFCLL